MLPREIISMITITGKEQIALARLVTLRAMLKLEVQGITMGKGRSAYTIVKESLGLKGSKQKVLDQLNKIISDLKFLTR